MPWADLAVRLVIVNRSYWTITDYRGLGWDADFTLYEIITGGGETKMQPVQYFSTLEEARAALPEGLSRATTGLPEDRANHVVERWE